MDDDMKIAIMAARKKRRAQNASAQAAGNQALMAAAGKPVDMSERTAAIENADAIAEKAMMRASMSRGEALAHGLASGATLGFNDELYGLIGGEGVRDAARKRLDLARTARPGLTTTAEIAGNVATGALVPGSTSVKGAALVGAGLAGADAAGRAEGGVVDRLDDAAIGAGTGLLFSGLMSGLWKGASAATKKIFEKTEARPTIENLRTVKDLAYRQVRNSGVKFSGDSMEALHRRASRVAKTARWDLDPVSEVDKAAFDALRVLERRSGRDITLNNLDKTRQKLWDMYRKSDHPFILQLIEEVDGVVDKEAAGNEIMKAARFANSKFAKAQVLENAFEKAERQTAATGSGGNILNNYRKAVNRIVDGKEAKYFSAEEIALMKDFVMGDNAENALRRVGKLAPGGNGLMTALNVYAAAIDPTMLAVSGVASAAKGAADRSAMQGSQNILDSVATGVIAKPKPPQAMPRLGGLAAAPGRLLD